jgi:hypothetical protein
MGNRSRYRPPAKQGYKQGFQAGMDAVVHLVLADVPGSGVTQLGDGTIDCADDAGCHSCALKEAGFPRLADRWYSTVPCEDHA